MWYKQGLREEMWPVQSQLFVITQVEMGHLHQGESKITMVFPHIKRLCCACRLSVDQKHHEGDGLKGFVCDR